MRGGPLGYAMRQIRNRTRFWVRLFLCVVLFLCRHFPGYLRAESVQVSEVLENLRFDYLPHSLQVTFHFADPRRQRENRMSILERLSQSKTKSALL